MPNKDTQRILIIDDEPDDVELTSEALLQVWPNSIIVGVGTAEAGLAKARTSSWSLILLDYKLPGKSGLEILRELRSLCPESSIILLTGHGDEATAVQVMLAGADYYLRKSSNFMIELPMVVREVLEKRHLRLRIKHTEERYHRLIEHITDIVFELDALGCFRFVSPAVLPILGYAPEEIKGVPVSHFLHPDDLPRSAHWFHKEGMERQATRGSSIRFLMKSGEIREIEVDATVIYDHRKQFSATVGIARDVTERKKAEASLARLRYKYELLLNSAHDGIYGLDLEGKTILVNPAAASMIGCTREELHGVPEKNYTASPCTISSITVNPMARLSRLRNVRFIKPFGMGNPIMSRRMCFGKRMARRSGWNIPAIPFGKTTGLWERWSHSVISPNEKDQRSV